MPQTTPRMLLALLLGFATACGDSSESAWVEETSGGEVEGDGIAKPVATAPESPAGQGQPNGSISNEPTILHPDLEAIPTVGSSGPPPPPAAGTPSPWGAPDAESGTPLPPRKAMAAAAVPLYRQGLALASSGDVTGAQQALERAAQADPKSYEVATALGIVADRGGQPNKALAQYRRALTLQPDYERAADGAVKLYLRSGDTAGAIAFVEPLAKRWERNLSLQAIYAEALVAADRLDEAEAVARKALKRDERFVPAMVAIARSSLRRGREELADFVLQQAVAIDPSNAEVHFLMGQSAERSGQVTAAMESFRKAAQLRPEYAEARTALGIQYLAAGNYAAALTELQAAARLAPMMPETHLNLGDAYRANKKWQDAKREFDLALRMQDNLPQAHFDLGLMYMEAGENFPGMDKLGAYERAVLEFNTYRSKLGAKLRSGDPSEGYLEDLSRQIDREKKRIEREQRRAAQASEG